MKFQPGLNVIVGPNNIGKTAVVDGLRLLLSGNDESPPRLSVDDIHQPKGGKPAGPIVLEYTFAGLSLDDEADFIPALVPADDGSMLAHFTLRYEEADSSGRMFRPKRWCGTNEENALSSDMLDNLRGVYLPPLRDAGSALKPSRTSQLSRLLQLLSDDAGREAINDQLEALDKILKDMPALVGTRDAISGRHVTMLGEKLAQLLEIGLSANDFQRLAARLSILVDSFEIEQNGLGYNNLIYMAVVLSELTKNPEAAYRGLIVEEPEAHLHPQLQAILLRYLEGIRTGGAAKAAEGGEEPKAAADHPVQVFVTSHSPNFASIAKLECISCLTEAGTGIVSFFPREAIFEKGKRAKLERYLDVTRAELFFAKKVIFVEGAGELMLVDLLAKKAGYDLREHGVSLISVEGLNFDCFLPLFGEKGLAIPVAVITDADPAKIEDGTGEEVPVYPSLTDTVEASDNAKALRKREDTLVKIFYGQKTFEYDLALLEKNRAPMLRALSELHPKIGKKLQEDIEGIADNTEAAKALFKGMFEKSSGNVQKGAFGQTLASVIADENQDFETPEYILSAIKHACGDHA
jgi:putative ATP-dependent endonuclease of OLD family